MYQVTGNEYISLPQIRTSDGGIENLTFLYMQAKGMIEMRGSDALILPYLQVEGKTVHADLQWAQAHDWIPSFSYQAEGIAFACTYFAPVGERGFAVRLTAVNTASENRSIRFGVRGDWAQTNHRVNESVPIEEGREALRSNWNHMFVFRQKPGLPLFAFAPITSDDLPFSEIDQGADWSLDGFAYDISKTVCLHPGAQQSLDVFFGIGYEEVSAATSAKEMLRQGYDVLYRRTENWLSARAKQASNEQLSHLLNTNLFFCFFFSTGRTLDTEELVMVTSRSPRYYVSAAYWDRDSMLWAFPAILSTDADYARELLLTVFQKQSRNFGVHSRFIDGTVLEPGFELDELCAPVIALNRYVLATGDEALAQESVVQNGLRGILRTLRTKRHPTIALYETFLQPSDDMRNFPYLTYDNALVCYAYRALARYLHQPELLQCAEEVRTAIYTHCVFEKDGKPFFAWSVDLNGHYDVYDDPPGSLQLLPFYGLCDETDEIWRNTVAIIRDESYPLSFAGAPIAEIGCKHAPHPWVLSLCNSLLSGHADTALLHLSRTNLDNGIACESVNEVTGECETGHAFATCAGFLACALMQAP